MTSNELLDYIKKAKNNGQADEQIKSDLIKGGWQNSDIDNVFDSINDATNILTDKSMSQEKSTISFKKILKWLLGLFGFLGIFGFILKQPLYYFFFFFFLLYLKPKSKILRFSKEKIHYILAPLFLFVIYWLIYYIPTLLKFDKLLSTSGAPAHLSTSHPLSDFEVYLYTFQSILPSIFVSPAVVSNWLAFVFLRGCNEAGCFIFYYPILIISLAVFLGFVIFTTYFFKNIKNFSKKKRSVFLIVFILIYLPFLINGFFTAKEVYKTYSVLAVSLPITNEKGQPADLCIKNPLPIEGKSGAWTQVYQHLSDHSAYTAVYDNLITIDFRIFYKSEDLDSWIKYYIIRDTFRKDVNSLHELLKIENTYIDRSRVPGTNLPLVENVRATGEITLNGYPINYYYDKAVRRFKYNNYKEEKSEWMMLWWENNNSSLVLISTPGQLGSMVPSPIASSINDVSIYFNDLEKIVTEYIKKCPPVAE